MAVCEVSASPRFMAQHRVSGLEHGRVGRLDWPCEPECGCTLTYSAPNSFRARSRAKFSTTSRTRAGVVALRIALRRTCW